MSVHDALEAWAEGRISVERALALTHAVDVAEMLVLCGLNDVQRLLLTGPPPPEADVVVTVGQRVAEPVEEALRERERQGR